MITLDLSDIQGNILKGYGLPVARYTFVQINDADSGRRFVGSLIDHVTTSQVWPTGPDGRAVKPTSTLNIAFTHAGMAALEVPGRTLDGFSRAFKEGMRARAGSVGDIGPNAPDHWDWDDAWRGDGKTAHMWISINAGDPDREVRSSNHAAHRLHLEPRFELLQELAGEHDGVEIIGFQDAGALGKRKEHFGYTDGISNPDVDGRPGPRRTRVGKLNEDNEWVPLATGEFILGYPDEAVENPAVPLPTSFSRNGSHMVYRKLHQNIATFRKFLREEGARYPGGEELLAAKLVGRWRDGTPIELSPTQPDPNLVANNEFRYGDDMEGLRCPMGAHVRRTNPRDHLGFEGKLTNRHRILRRGLPYGTPLGPNETPSDDGQHGVIFITINASIERQFEFVQREWVNYGNDFFAGNDKDPVVGAQVGGGRMVIPGDPEDPAARPTWICSGLKSFVETRGGDYFFLPGLAALRRIAAGTVETT